MNGVPGVIALESQAFFDFISSVTSWPEAGIMFSKSNSIAYTGTRTFPEFQILYS